MAKTQCIFLGDEIATGLYNKMKAMCPGIVTTILNFKSESDMYDSSHLNYDFNKWNWNNDLNVRAAPWYVISTGTWDLNQDQFANMKAIRNQIANARNGFSTPPHVIWIYPGVGPNYDVYPDIYRSGFWKILNSQNYTGDKMVTGLHDWSSILMPPTYFPDVPSTIYYIYKALGYTTFPHTNPIPLSISKDGNYPIRQIATLQYVRAFYIRTYGLTAANQLFTYVDTLYRNQNLLGTYTTLLDCVVSSHWSWWYNQTSYSIMKYPYVKNANNWSSISYDQWRMYYYTGQYCNTDRRHPKDAGYYQMVSQCLRLSNNFVG